MARQKQVAALPWRQTGDGIEILLVTTRTTRRWVIPKGWPMSGKSDPEAAAQEAYEEAGVQGQVDAVSCGQYRYIKISENGRAREITVTVYPLHVTEEHSTWPEQHERQRRWINVSEAGGLVGEAGLVPVLKAFGAGRVPETDVGQRSVQLRPQSFWQRFINLFR